ncbi:MAG: peptidylprolyl isomerase [Bacteroidales bacterium]|jgi:peptidyl-prolyl cis-trans isomerase SurA|nr:peptidylprolyl isomerase [Bacteroidales bacterium]
MRLSSLLMFCFFAFNGFSQHVIDEVVVVVGDEMIKKSDVQNQYMQMKSSGNSEADMCEIFEDLLFQKLLLTQAKIDSIALTDAEIDSEIERRVNVYTSQEGGLQKLEEFYGKTELEIKTEWRPLVREQILIQRMKNSLVGEVKITPNEVRTYYESLPKDSLPEIETQYEYAQIVIVPKVSKKEEERIKKELENIRQRILSGEKFEKLAILYSDDQESAKMGGLLGDYMSRGELVPEFSAVAFRLEEGELSRIVKTDFGYHIILMVERKGQKAKLKHILMRPRTSPESLTNASNKADSVYQMLQQDSITFERAAKLYSSDPNTKNNGGVFMNPYTGTSKFSEQVIDPVVLRVLKNLSQDQISEPFMTYDQKGNRVFKIIRLIDYVPSHTATILQDYDIVKQMAVEYKEQQILKKWVLSKQEKIYIQFMSDIYSDCEYSYPGWQR